MKDQDIPLPARVIPAVLLLGAVAILFWILSPQVPKLAVPFVRLAGFFAGATFGWYLRYLSRGATNATSTVVGVSLRGYWSRLRRSRLLCLRARNAVRQTTRR